MKLFFAFLTLLLTTVSFSQETKKEKDLSLIGGAQLNAMDYGKFGLMYRQKATDNLYFKMSATYDIISRDDLLNNQLIFDSDSLKIYRTQREWDRLYMLRGGVDFEPNRFLSFGASMVVGLNSSALALHSSGEHYDPETDSWQSCIECTYDYHGSTPREQDNGSINLETLPYGGLMGKNTYLVYGLSLNAGVKLPLGDRFEVGLFYSPEITRHELLKSDMYYKGTDYHIKDFSSVNRFTHYTDLLLRVRI